MHIIHATFSIAAAFAFVVLTILITLTFFKNLASPTDASARSDSRCEI